MEVARSAPDTKQAHPWRRCACEALRLPAGGTAAGVWGRIE
jgi:hypothetical protein